LNDSDRVSNAVLRADPGAQIGGAPAHILIIRSPCQRLSQPVDGQLATRCLVSTELVDYNVPGV
jgi:hypothetical protein